MDVFLQDLKHSLRMFVQNRGFTAAAVAALALGIGANTAIFSVVNAVLLKPMPFPDPDRIVLFLNTSPNGSGPGASPAKFRHWRQQTTVVQDVTAYRSDVVNTWRELIPRAVALGPGVRRLLPPVRRADHPRPRFHGRGRPAEGRPRRAHQPQVCGRAASTAMPILSAGRCRSEAIPTRSSASSVPASTSEEFGRPPDVSCHFSSTRTRPIRATTSRWPDG